MFTRLLKGAYMRMKCTPFSVATGHCREHAKRLEWGEKDEANLQEKLLSDFHELERHRYITPTY
jgi:uncharacterized cysteine cluster protein YcgN (CxxCxxCC family)